jgi:hypothetical protein
LILTKPSLARACYEHVAGHHAASFVIGPDSGRN